MNQPSNPYNILPLPQDPQPVALNEIPTSELVTSFLKAKIDVGRSPKTVADYGWALKGFAEANPFLPMDPVAIEDYFGSLSHLNDESVKDVCRVLVTFYNWLIRRRYIPVHLNPFLMVERPRVRRKLPKFLSATAMRRVLQVSRPPVERALILVLLNAGPRVGELVGLTKDNVRDRSLILSPGKTGERIIPLDDEVVDYLLALDTDYLFPARGFGPLRWAFTGKPLTVGGMGEVVRRVLKRAGLRGTKLGPHMLRHSFGTHFISRKGDLITLSKVLGHTSTRMSERYVSLSLVDVQEKFREVGVLRSLMGMAPATPARELPKVSLPVDAREVPLQFEGRPVMLMLVEDKRPNHTYYYIRARVGWGGGEGSKRWPVASLGTDLPLELVDAYRRAVADENLRRQNS